MRICGGGEICKLGVGRFRVAAFWATMVQTVVGLRQHVKTMSMHAYMHICMHAYILFICLFIYLFIYLYIHIYKYTHKRMCTHTQTYTGRPTYAHTYNYRHMNMHIRLRMIILVPRTAGKMRHLQSSMIDTVNAAATLEFVPNSELQLQWLFSFRCRGALGSRLLFWGVGQGLRVEGWGLRWSCERRPRKAVQSGDRLFVFSRTQARTTLDWEPSHGDWNRPMIGPQASTEATTMLKLSY